MRLCLIVLLFVSNLYKAQYNTEFINYSDVGRSVTAHLDFEAGSNGMNTAMINKLVWGGHIDNELKDRSSKYLRAKSNFGINVNFGVSAFIKATNK